MLGLTKYYLKHLDDECMYLAEELIDYHCQNVNPKDLVISSQFFQTLATDAGFLNKPLVRHYLALSQYTKELLHVPPADAANLNHHDSL